ncbi:late embryogenesis abundant protein D-34-like protein [Carex littledalei]|uniref:Late embryogenesis abundant protein D-34-like protein n=1 Tax=Carex littledalei TaxID=544730 RepID=A0A833VFU8_9POAL|nr:late embryogenesis abundant protein D-34-like protein [Carex littledalei]
MSQDQPRRNQEQHDLSLRDVAMMQSADNTVLRETRNERAGVVSHDRSTDVSEDNGVTITETFVPGGRIITEFVARQVVSQHIAPGPGDAGTIGPGGGYRGGLDSQGEGGDGCIDNSGNVDPIKITIGEALEAAGNTAQDKLVEQSDVAAIQAAEARAIGLNVTMPGGIAAHAQSAADANLWATRDEDKAKLSDVLSDAAGKLPADKPVERDDAARVVGAEISNKEDARTTPAGVAATMAAAARLNEGFERTI